MAKTGIRYAVFAEATEASDGTITYSNGKCLSPVAGFNGSINQSNGKDYGDDRVVATDNTVTGGTLTVELNEDNDDIYTMLLGHAVASGTGADPAIQYKDTDVAPFIGTGAIGRSGDKWVGKWYTKVQFHEPADDNATAQENITFGHVTLEGDILIPANGLWKERETFDTLTAAKTWLNGKAGISG